MIAIGGVATAVVGKTPKADEINDALVTNSVLAGLAIPGILFLTMLLTYDVARLWQEVSGRQKRSLAEKNVIDEGCFDDLISILAGGYSAFWGVLTFLFLALSAFFPGKTLIFTKKFFSDPSNVMLLLGALFAFAAFVIWRYGGVRRFIEEVFLGFLVGICLLCFLIAFLSKC